MLEVQTDASSTYKTVAEVKIGDTVRTMQNGELKWTEVLRNIKSQGQFEFIKISTKNNENAIRDIEVTPEHGMIFVNKKGALTTNSAAHVQEGDVMTDLQGNNVSVVAVHHTVLNTKYTLETFDGTVLASGIFITTLCNDVLSDGPLLLGNLLENWANNHTHDICLLG